MTTTRYIIGFVLSLAVTCVSFGIVWIHLAASHQTISHTVATSAVLTLALVQLVVQLMYFLHLGRASKARDVLALALAGFLIAFIVIGSLWIMASLDTTRSVPFDGAVTPQTSR